MSKVKGKKTEAAAAPSTAKRSARTGNVQAVLDVLRTDGPSSQAAISRRTGLAPATINNIVQALRSEGVADVQWINGREALIELISNHGAIVSIYVTPEYVRGALFDFAKKRRFDKTILTSDKGGGDIDIAADLMRALAKDARIPTDALAGAAVAMSAPVDRHSGAIASWASSRIPLWRNINVPETLSEALRIPVIVDNDANLSALAEWTWGAGRGSDCFLYVTCSKWIGGGLVIDGKVHRGGNGMALEIGHIVVEQTGPVCFCGSRGCLSTLASERSILMALQGSESSKQTLAEVIQSAHQGDAACQRVLFEAGRNVGRALANMVKLIAPSVVAIGGELASAGSIVFDSLNTSIEENNVMAFSPTIQFRPAQIAGETSLLGGVAAIMDQLGQGLSELPEWMKESPMAAPAVRNPHTA